MRETQQLSLWPWDTLFTKHGFHDLGSKTVCLFHAGKEILGMKDNRMWAHKMRNPWTVTLKVSHTDTKIWKKRKGMSTTSYWCFISFIDRNFVRNITKNFLSVLKKHKNKTTSLLRSTHIPLGCGVCVSLPVLLLLPGVALCASVHSSTAAQSPAEYPDPLFHLDMWLQPSVEHIGAPEHTIGPLSFCRPVVCETEAGVWSQSLCFGRTAQCGWSADSVLASHPRRYCVRPWHVRPSGWQWDGTSQSSPCAHAKM